jgi:segregation and condensation protein A
LPVSDFIQKETETPVEAVTAAVVDDDAATPEEREPSPYNVSIDEFEGPLDLLLDLIRKHRVDIFDIPIAKITDQYLGFIRRADELNVELSAEFVLMAATLIQIKSKMLLPTDPAIPGEEPEDPREELVKQLLDREVFINAAQMLKHKRIVEENVWSVPADEKFEDESDEELGLAVTLFDLVQTFEEVLERFKNRPTLEVEEEEVSVAGRITYLKNLLKSADGPISVRDVFLRQTGRRALVATFLAVLELVKAQAIALRQSELFGDIVIQKHKMFDAAFDDDGSFLATDAEYQS